MYGEHDKHALCHITGRSRKELKQNIHKRLKSDLWKLRSYLSIALITFPFLNHYWDGPPVTQVIANVCLFLLIFALSDADEHVAACCMWLWLLVRFNEKVQWVN